MRRSLISPAVVRDQRPVSDTVASHVPDGSRGVSRALVASDLCGAIRLVGALSLSAGLMRRPSPA